MNRMVMKQHLVESPVVYVFTVIQLKAHDHTNSIASFHVMVLDELQRPSPFHGHGSGP